MTIQEAAKLILEEQGAPLKSKEIASHALDRGLVTSNSKDQIQSLSTTIDKNIRGEIYNNPKLIFLHTPVGRLIGLPSWGEQHKPSTIPIKEKGHEFSHDLRALNLRIPNDLLENLELATQARIANTFEETVAYILKKGLAAITPAIKEGLSRQLSKLDNLKK